MMKVDSASLLIIYAKGIPTLNNKSLTSAAAHHSTVCWSYYYWSGCFHWFATQNPKPSK